jgi:hypothetical protein
MKPQRDHIDEWEALIDSVGPPAEPDPDLAGAEVMLDPAHQIDLAAGEFFRHTWRRRLADAQGDVGYVARQMRKAGIPLDLALVILLADPGPPWKPPTPVAPDVLRHERAADTTAQRALSHAA